MDDTIPTINKLEVNRQKLKGRFKIRIASKLPFGEKVKAFANDDLSFYIH